MNWEQTNEENRLLHHACHQLDIEPMNTFFCPERGKVVFVLGSVKEARRLSKHIGAGYKAGERINRFEVWNNG